MWKYLPLWPNNRCGSDRLTLQMLRLLDGKVALSLLVHLGEGWVEGLRETSTTALGSLGTSAPGPRWTQDSGTTWWVSSRVKGWMNNGVWLGEPGTDRGRQGTSGLKPVACPSSLHKTECVLSLAEPGIPLKFQGISLETRLERSLSLSLFLSRSWEPTLRPWQRG